MSYKNNNNNKRTSVSSPAPTRNPIHDRAQHTVQEYSTKGAQVLV